jgi:hypothetical protein
MSEKLFTEAGPWGVALLSFDLLGFDARAFEVVADTQDKKEPSSDDFRLIAPFGDAIELRLDYSHDDQAFYLAASCACSDQAASVHLDALKVNYLLDLPRRAVFNPATSRLEVISEVLLEGLEIEDLAFELHYLAEVALVLLGFSGESESQAEIDQSQFIRG